MEDSNTYNKNCKLQVMYLHKHVNDERFIPASMCGIMISRELFPMLWFRVNSISCLTGFCKSKDDLEKG